MRFIIAISMQLYVGHCREAWSSNFFLLVETAKRARSFVKFPISARTIGDFRDAVTTSGKTRRGGTMNRADITTRTIDKSSSACYFRVQRALKRSKLFHVQHFYDFHVNPRLLRPLRYFIGD